MHHVWHMVSTLQVAVVIMSSPLCRSYRNKARCAQNYKIRQEFRGRIKYVWWDCCRKLRNAFVVTCSLWDLYKANHQLCGTVTSPSTDTVPPEGLLWKRTRAGPLNTWLDPATPDLMAVMMINLDLCVWDRNMIKAHTSVKGLLPVPSLVGTSWIGH